MTSLQNESANDTEPGWQPLGARFLLFLWESMIPCYLLPSTDWSASGPLVSELDDCAIHTSKRGVLDDGQPRQTGNGRSWRPFFSCVPGCVK